MIAIARHSETTEPMVVYRALYGEGGDIRVIRGEYVNVNDRGAEGAEVDNAEE